MLFQIDSLLFGKRPLFFLKEQRLVHVLFFNLPRKKNCENVKADCESITVLKASRLTRVKTRNSSFFTVFSIVFCVLMHVSQGSVDGW